MSVVQHRAPTLGAFVPHLLADWRRDPDRRWWQRTGSMLSADISGFTKLSERLAGLGNEGAEELTDLINECFDGMIDVAADQGGDVLKFGGDALLLLFTGPGHVERACAAAVGMRASIARPLRTRSVARVALKMSQGIHSGELLFFVVDAGHHELLVTGPGATSTVECESTAAAGEILLSAGAAALAPPSWLGGERDGGRLLRRVGATEAFVDLTEDGRHGAPVDDLISAAQREQIEAGVAGEHRQVAVAFVKFSHVDELVASRGPEELATRLDALAASVRAAVERYGIHWLGTDIAPDGGKLILTAGAPVSAGDDEERMLRAVREIVTADPGLHLRAGVNAGHVFAGIVGSGRRRVYTVMGDAVNLAARLMQHAGSGDVVATLDTIGRSATRFDLEPLPPFLVKGKAEPIAAAQVRAVAADVGVRAASVTAEVPLIGRGPELDRIDAAIEASTGGATTVVDVVADVGLGKSRLLDEVQRRHADHLTVTAAGGQYARSTPYFALRQALRRLVGVPVVATAAAAGKALAAAVERDAPALRPWLPLLALPLGAEVPATAEVDQLAAAFRRTRLHAAVRSLLEAVPGGPLLVVVDDAHWLDEASLDLLEHLTALDRPSGTTIVVAREPGGSVVAPVEGDAVTIALEPLDRAATTRLVVAAATHDLLPDVVDTLVEHSGGHPLFAIELARTATPGARGALPDSVESLVTVRIDTLPAAARRLLREVSVLGSRVDRHLAAAAFDLDPDDDTAWDQLDGFLEPHADGTLRFRHSTFRTVAYEGLPFRRRRELHERVGRALETSAAGGADVDELLSLHFHRAQVGPPTWRYSRRAGDQARTKYANVDAAELYRRALDGAGWGSEVSPVDARDVWIALGDACELSARFDDASLAYASALRLARGDPRAQIEILEKRGVVSERSGRYGAALQALGRGLRLAESLPPGERAAAVGSLARAYAAVRYRQGRWADCVRWAKRAAAEAEATGDRRTLAHAWYLLDIALGSLGSPEAAAYRGRSLPIFEELGDLVGQANALNNEGVDAYYGSRWHEAVDRYQRSERARERAGDVVGAATEANNLGEVRSDQGHLDEARGLFERALRTWRAASYPVGVAVALSNLGRTAARAGDHERALVLLEDARVRYESIGAAGLAAEAEVRTVECLVLAGRFDEAAAQIEALGSKVHDGVGDDLLAALLDRQIGWVRLRSGDDAGAVAAFEASIGRAESLGARFEVALTRLAMTEVPRIGQERRAADEAAARATLAELEVVAVPKVP